MSATWSWEPVIEPPSGGALSLEMRGALAGGDPPDQLEGTTLGQQDVAFLRGVVAGSGSGSELAVEARELIDAISTHGKVRIRVDR